MRYVKFLALALLALLAFKIAFSLLGESGLDQQNGGELRIEPRIIDLGTVILNQAVDFTTSMRNSGSKPIKIAKIERSCGCIQAFPAKETCQPGETVSVRGTLVPNKLGRFRYLVKFLEEDNSAPEHVIEVVGKAESGAGSIPQSPSSNP